MPHTGNDTISSDDFAEVAFSGDYNDLINTPGSNGLTVTVAYSNPNLNNVGATTLSTKYPDYKLAIFVNQHKDNGTHGATPVILAKGHSAEAGVAWGTYYGRRTYTFASDGTISWTAYESSNIIPKYVYVIK